MPSRRTPLPPGAYAYGSRTSSLDHAIRKDRRHTGEESFYRVELEALIQIYLLLPPQYRARHACDNEAAVKAHTSIRYHARKSARKWARVDYRTTLDSLHQAITARGGEGLLQVVHTHSHLENILALADEAANIAHTLQPTRTGTSHREKFTVHNRGCARHGNSVEFCGILSLGATTEF